MVTANNYMFRPLTGHHQVVHTMKMVEASTDASSVLLLPHHTPRSSQSATHQELHSRALLLISSS